jgi:hypothetical protein
MSSAVKPIDYSLYLVTGRDLLPPGKVDFLIITHYFQLMPYRITWNRWNK